MASEKKGPLRTTKTCSLITMLVLTSGFFLVEIIVGYATHSVALIADSFHMLSDVISLIVGFLALRYSKKSRKTARNTFGWQRAEVLGALINAVFLIALCFTILVEGLKRMVVVEEITNAWLVLIVGGVGLAVNLVGLCMFHGHGHGHSHGGHEHGHSHGNGQQHPSETVIDNTATINSENGSVTNLAGSDGSLPRGDTFSGPYLKDAHEIQKFATGLFPFIILWLVCPS